MFCAPDLYVLPLLSHILFLPHLSLCVPRGQTLFLVEGPICVVMHKRIQAVVVNGHTRQPSFCVFAEQVLCSFNLSFHLLLCLDSRSRLVISVHPA